MPEDKQAPTKQLFDPKRIQLSEYATRSFTVTVEQGTAERDVLDPAFFAHFAPQFNVYDEITVRVDDGTWYGKFLVCSCGRTWTKLRTIFCMQLTEQDVDMSQAAVFDGYEVKWRGPLCKWSVIRKQDKMAVFEKGEDKLAADTWLAQHVKSPVA
jgi:hypothetical protein